MVSLRLKTLKLRLQGVQTMTLISAYVPILDAPKDSKKIFCDNLSVAINAILANGKESFLDMSMTEVVRTTINHMKFFKYNFRQY